MNYVLSTATSETGWQRPRGALSLAVEECHVWRVGIGAAPSGAALAVLDAAERERAARFVFERDRGRYLAAHVALREVLARYLGVEPAALVFAEGLHGRPQLAGACAGKLEFNLSHSGELALIAVACGGPLGVDVEVLRPVADWRELAARYFTAAECAALEAAGADPQVQFLRCWSRKEAALKSTGIGLSEEPRSVCVGPGPDAARPRVRGAAADVEVEVVSIDLPGAAVAACAMRPGVHVAQQFDFGPGH